MKRIGIISGLFIALCTLPALAGTTGVLRGRVVDAATQRPIAGAAVIAESPQAIAKTTTDANGNYVFITLAPGSYTVSVQAHGFVPVSVAQVPVQADRALLLAIADPRELRVITDRGMGRLSRTSLVQRGIGSDVYTVYTPSLRDSSVPGRTNADVLQFVPGVQVGPASMVTHH